MINIKTKLFALAIGLLLTFSVSACAGQKTNGVTSQIELIKPKNINFNTYKVVKTDIYYQDVFAAAVKYTDVKEMYFSDWDLTLNNKYVRAGDYVKKGDKILDADTEDIEIEINNKQRYISKLTKSNDNEIHKKILDLELAEATLEYLNYCLTISNDETEKAKLKQEINSQTTTISKINLSIEHTNNIFELTLENEQNQLRQLQEKKERYTIFAPIDGIVLYLTSLSRGEYITAYSAVVTVAASDSINVAYSGDKMIVGDERYRFSARIGDKEYSCSYMEEENKDVLNKIIAKIPVDIVFKIENRDESITPGQFAELYMRYSDKTGVIAVPLNCVNNSAGESYVYLIKNGVKVRQIVDTGIITQSQAEIISGLSEGDEVFVKQ